MMPTYLTKAPIFPDPALALDEPNGLLAIGGDLSPERIINAYHNGIFPWFSSGEPILWWSPNPRAVIYPQHLYISRSLKKFIRQQSYRITLNHNFALVMAECANRPQEETWISPEMCTAYFQLHQQGIAHSVEIWAGEELIGGLYGIGQGKIFCGESMFSTRPNVSKLALVALCQHLVAHDFVLIDSQVLNPHTASLGAVEISRTDYLKYLHHYRNIQPSALCWSKQELIIHT